MAIRGKNVTEETFGTDPKNPPLRKGVFEAVGHTIKDGSPLPNKGFSPNVKTGHPVASSEK